MSTAPPTTTVTDSEETTISANKDDFDKFNRTTIGSIAGSIAMGAVVLILCVIVFLFVIQRKCRLCAKTNNDLTSFPQVHDESLNISDSSTSDSDPGLAVTFQINYAGREYQTDVEGHQSGHHHLPQQPLNDARFHISDTISQIDIVSLDENKNSTLTEFV